MAPPFSLNMRSSPAKWIRSSAEWTLSGWFISKFNEIEKCSVSETVMSYRDGMPARSSKIKFCVLDMGISP